MDKVTHDENCERKAQWRVTVDGIVLSQNYFGLGENSTGGALWDSSLVMWQKLDKMDWTNKNVLELGSGIGFLAIKMALSGAKVVATDGDDEALCILRENLKRNNQTTVISTNCLKWGEKESIMNFQQTYPKTTTFDYVIGADLIFNCDYHDSLIETLIQVVPTQSTKLLLAYRIRHEDKEKEFITKIQQHFTLTLREEVIATNVVYLELQRATK